MFFQTYSHSDGCNRVFCHFRHAVVISLYALLPCSLLIGCSCQSKDEEIHKAARLGSLTKIEALLKSGISVNATDSSGSTPLMVSIEGVKKEEECFKVVKWLVEHGANVNHYDSLDRSALSMAAERNFVNIIKLLLDHKANINARGPLSGNTALLAATDLGHALAIEALLKRGADPNLANLEKRLPIHSAVNNSTSCLRLLLVYGAKPNNMDEYGLSPLHYLMMIPPQEIKDKDRMERTRLLIKHGADPMKRCPDTIDIPDSGIGWRVESPILPEPGETPLQMAQRLKYQQMVHLFMKSKQSQQAEPKAGEVR